jgi:hypothetical protein
MLNKPKEENMKIFGEVDKDRDGKVKSDYPAWYFETHQEELEESVRQKERQLAADLIPDSEKGIMKSRLKQEKERLDKIRASKPELKDTEKDDVAKVTKEIGNSIASSMFTGSDMKRGTADAHEEARRISSPVIEVKSEKQAELVKMCGINIKDGKITRGEAEKVWKIARRMLGEQANTEILRKG